MKARSRGRSRGQIFTHVMESLHWSRNGLPFVLCWRTGSGIKYAPPWKYCGARISCEGQNGLEIVRKHLQIHSQAAEPCVEYAEKSFGKHRKVDFLREGTSNLRWLSAATARFCSITALYPGRYLGPSQWDSRVRCRKVRRPEALARREYEPGL